MNQIWTCQAIEKKGELLVLLAMADWADDEGYCWPSDEAIAKKARMTRTSVARLRRKMRGRYLEWENQARKNIQINNHYRIMLENLRPGVSQSHTEDSPGVSLSASRCVPVSLPGVSLGHTDTSSIHINTIHQKDVRQQDPVSGDGQAFEIPSLTVNQDGTTLEPETPPKPEPPPYAEAEQSWNEFAARVGLSPVHGLNDSRRAAIRQRHQKIMPKAAEIYAAIEASDFLMGRVKQWRITFDFLWTKANTWQKILEGNYQNSTPKPKQTYGNHDEASREQRRLALAQATAAAAAELARRAGTTAGHA